LSRTANSRMPYSKSSIGYATSAFDGPRFTGSLYLRCDDVDADWKRASSKADVAYPIEDFEYGMREFAVRDNNGYLIQFGMPLDAEAEG
ncbi:MAG: VOC family protein, partial [Planctomycetota bacterium]